MADFQIDPATTPVHLITNRLHIAAIGMAAEAGFEFRVLEIILPPLRTQPISPVLRLEIGGKVTAYLVPIDLMFSECMKLFATSRELSLVVCPSYSLPRSDSLLPTALKMMTAGRWANNRREDTP